MSEQLGGSERLVGRFGGWVGLLAGSALVAVLLAPAGVLNGPAPGAVRGADEAPTRSVAGKPVAPVTVARHRSDLGGLTLLAASASGYAVQYSTHGIDGAPSPILTGPRGSTLIDRGSHAGPTNDVPSPSYSWAEWGTPNWLLHRVDLITGEDSQYRSPDQPVAWTSAGWVGFDPTALTLSLDRPEHRRRTLIDDVQGANFGSAELPVVSADDDGAVISSIAKVAGTVQQRIALVSFTTPGLDQLDAAPPYSSYRLVPSGLGRQTALSASTVAWTSYSGPSEEHQVLHLRSRAGGATTSTPIPDGADPNSITAAADRVGLLSPSVTGSTTNDQVSVYDAGSWRTMGLPGPASGLRAVGSHFVVAVGGPAGTAGVYEIADGASQRVASVRPPGANFMALSLSAGRLRYLDTAISAGRGGALWERSVATAHGALTLGPDHRLTAAEPDTLDSYPVTLSASAGRTLVQTRTVMPPAYRLLDRGVFTHTLPVDAWSYIGGVDMSGPYTRIGDKFFGADGTLITDLTAQNVADADLFGPKVIYSTTTGLVRVLDLSRPVAAGNPLTLVGSLSCNLADLAGCGFQVAIWGDTVAWSRHDSTLAIRTLSSTATRRVRTPDRVVGLRMSEGALAWNTASEGDTVTLLDLKSPTSTPRTVSGLKAFVVDDHLLAGLDRHHLLSLRPLPFGSSAKYPPRLLGVVVTDAFTPVGSASAGVSPAGAAPAGAAPSGAVAAGPVAAGAVAAGPVAAGAVAAGDWAPQVDVSKPVSRVRMVISREGSVVRTLVGTGPDGSIRNLSWDGRDDSGLPVAAGGYTWVLTATAKDGGGALTTADGRGRVSGAVQLNR